MNLTYFDDDFSDAKFSSVSDNAMRGLAIATDQYHAYNDPQLGGFFKSLVKTIKRTHAAPLKLVKGIASGGVKGGINAVKTELKAVRDDDLRQVVAPVLSAVSVVLPVLAPVAALAKAGGEYALAKKNEKLVAGAKEALETKRAGELWEQYKGLAGTIPGRQIATLLRDILDAYCRISPDFYPEKAGELYTSFSDTARDGVKNGIVDAKKLSDMWINANPNAMGNDGKAIKLVQDIFDYEIFKINPNPEPAPTPTATTPKATTPAVISSPSIPAQQTALSLPSSGVDAALAARVQSMLDAMQAQGANQQQMVQSAINALQSQGVNTNSPAVQRAIVADAGATVATAGVSKVNPYLLAGLGAVALVLALARPKRN